MPRYKKKSYAPKRPTYRARKSFRKMGPGRKMQRTALSFTKKKYTAVFPLSVAQGTDLTEVTISNFGGRNSTTPLETITLNSCNPDNLQLDDMQLHQQFRITGVALKLYFPEGTTPAATPV